MGPDPTLPFSFPLVGGGETLEGRQDPEFYYTFPQPPPTPEPPLQSLRPGFYFFCFESLFEAYPGYA